MLSGWVFDAYPVNDKMVIWLKTRDNQTIRLEDAWTCSIFVASDIQSDLSTLLQNEAVQHYVKSHAFVQRYERVTDLRQSTVLKLTLRESAKVVALANAIEDIDNHDKFRLYNVDVLPAQSYFYEHGIFTLAKCNVSIKNNNLQWELNDDVKSTNYELPEFRVINLRVDLKQEGRLPQFTDKIQRIRIKTSSEIIEIGSQSEEQTLIDLMRETTKLDPDFIFTRDGDEFVFPYLVKRAANNGLELGLSREKKPILKPSAKGVTYFSYGRVHYRPSSVTLYGRIHIDTRNWVQLAWSESDLVDDSTLQGLFEISRICRMPLHTASRVTIGRCLSSMQIYLAHKRGILVPWKPTTLEHDKTFKQLLVADRGGFILEPVVGVHEKVAEFDFVGLFPNIMRKLNISGETVNCECCPDSKNIVPEIGFRICEKRRGLVSEALEVPLDNRATYKHLKKMATDDKSWAIYESRQGILRSIGHVSFGYLGHANSKFGLIDAHIAVCANARMIAKKARRVAESLSYDVLHVIIDSIFARKEDATHQDYVKLKQEIEAKTNFDINYEGEYKWIVFLPSKTNGQSPVTNRYFGVYQDGTIKDRGIETRRHDTPPLFARFQREILKIMATGDSIKEVQALMPVIFDTFQRYKQRLEEKKVPLMDLVFTKMLSKDSDSYSVNTAEKSAMHQLVDEGETMRAGETLRYVITDYYRKNARKRTVPIELVNEKTTYDAKRYVELLAETCNSVTEPFGYAIDGSQSMQL